MLEVIPGLTGSNRLIKNGLQH